MSRRQMKVEICNYLFTSNEIKEIDFTDDFIYKKVQDTEYKFEEIYFFAQLGLISNSVNCIYCFQDMQLTFKSNIPDKYVWRCKRPCRKEINIRSNSIFESLKVPMLKFCRFCKTWCKEDSQAYIKDELKLNKNTISSWCFHLRKTIHVFLIENRELLGDLDEKEIERSSKSTNHYFPKKI